MILICFDGSDDARAAIRQAGQLMPGQPTAVMTVWEPYTEMLARASAGLGPVADGADIQAIDNAGRDYARQCSEDGAALARECGLDAHAAGVAQHLSVADAILFEADRQQADVIVIGSRGRGPVTSALLGSVSHDLMQHADRPVLVVPSPHVAQRRHEHRTRFEVTVPMEPAVNPPS